MFVRAVVVLPPALTQCSCVKNEFLVFLLLKKKTRLNVRAVVALLSALTQYNCVKNVKVIYFSYSKKDETGILSPSAQA